MPPEATELEGRKLANDCPVFETEMVAVDCEGVPEALHLIQISTCAMTFVFDCVKLGAPAVCAVISDLLTDPAVLKLFHDVHMDAVALAIIGGIEPLHGVLDTQLAMESLTGELHMGFNRMLEQLELPPHPSKKAMKPRMGAGSIFAQRPLPADILRYAADDVTLLCQAQDRLRDALGDTLLSVQRASDARALLAPQNGGARQICFDVANTYTIASLELLREQRPQDMVAPTPLEVSDETDNLLSMLPDDLKADLHGLTRELSDINLDEGRRHAYMHAYTHACMHEPMRPYTHPRTRVPPRPHAWANGERLFLGKEERLVESKDIEAVVERLGGFGGDNRAGLERQLHRVSAIRNRQSDIIGLTMRVGRHVSGNATMISDLLFADTTRSILFLGEPGSGKTTVVRETTRLLAERANVQIVDTSNEIAVHQHPEPFYTRSSRGPPIKC